MTTSAERKRLFELEHPRPNHIGIAQEGKWYVITAEFKEGYLVLGYYQTLTAAKRALPGVKREFLQIGRYLR